MNRLYFGHTGRAEPLGIFRDNRPGTRAARSGSVEVVSEVAQTVRVPLPTNQTRRGKKKQKQPADNQDQHAGSGRSDAAVVHHAGEVAENIRKPDTSECQKKRQRQLEHDVNDPEPRCHDAIAREHEKRA